MLKEIVSFDKQKNKTKDREHGDKLKVEITAAVQNNDQTSEKQGRELL